MPSETAPTGGAATESDSDFLGGFDATTPVKIPGPRRGTGGWGGGLVQGEWGDMRTPPTSATLGELREIGAGGYIGSDQWLPSNLPPPGIAQLQSLLVEAGLLDLGELEHDQLGFYDEATRNAYRDLLTRANASGSSWENTLTRLRQNPAATSRRPSGRDRAPFAAQVTHPEDIKRGLSDYFREALGSGAIAPEKIDDMVKAYQGQQVASQQSAYNASIGGGTVTEPMDFETFADTQAKIADPTAYDSRKVVGAADVLSRMLGGDF